MPDKAWKGNVAGARTATASHQENAETGTKASEDRQEAREEWVRN